MQTLHFGLRTRHSITLRDSDPQQAAKAHRKHLSRASDPHTDFQVGVRKPGGYYHYDTVYVTLTGDTRKKYHEAFDGKDIPTQEHVQNWYASATDEELAANDEIPPPKPEPKASSGNDWPQSSWRNSFFAGGSF